jgi:pyruvate dehydrogenase E2 component (dihydrolipoamide acetyltransferase)
VDRGRRGGSVLSASAAKGETTVIEPTPAERTVARRAAQSRATIPTLELSVAVPMDGELRTGRLLRASALALREHPRANAAYRDGHFELYSRINVGIVVSDPERYLIPTVFDADVKSDVDLENEAEALARGALAGELGAPAYTGATFTVWNAARHGIATASIPVVAPQAAALAAGTAALTLACDHRILYGTAAAGFLKAIAHHLERDGV